MTHNNAYHPRTKHIALQYHFIRQCIDDGTSSLSWVNTDSNIADIFTKGLDSRETGDLTFSLGVRA